MLVDQAKACPGTEESYSQGGRISLVNSFMEPKNRQSTVIRCGPVSSMHDRACELYYTIKGGRVDYGEEHSRECGHVSQISGH